MEGGQERLSCCARNDGAAGRGRKSRPAVAGIRARSSAASSAFGQTSHIEDADGRGSCLNNRNDDRRQLIGFAPPSMAWHARWPTPAHAMPQDRRASPLQETARTTSSFRTIGRVGDIAEAAERRTTVAAYRRPACLSSRRQESGGGRICRPGPPGWRAFDRNWRVCRSEKLQAQADRCP